MKKIILSIILILTVITQLPVHAANYEIKELIPADIETTIVTNRFSYKGFYYNVNKEDGDKSKRNSIVFRGIKNLSDEARPITISIALFDEKRLNIGTINYCTGNINPGEEITYEIPVTKEYLGDGFKAKDVKYISVLSDNLNCTTGGADYYIGETVEKIGIAKNNVITKPIELTLVVFIVVGAVLLFLFLYSFMFTTEHMNYDGEDTRRKFVYINKKLKQKRELQAMLHPEPEPEKKSEKSDKVLQQEEEAKNADKTGTDLHNMYK